MARPGKMISPQSPRAAIPPTERHVVRQSKEKDVGGAVHITWWCSCSKFVVEHTETLPVSEVTALVEAHMAGPAT